MKLHADEVDIDSDLVRRLVAQQFPVFSELPVSPLQTTGTVNAIYRLGEDLCVRLPRVARWAGGLDKECTWLPRLARGLTLQVPEPVAKGAPTSEYPFSWAIFRWIQGQPYAADRVDDERQVAADLAQFVAQLRRNDLPPINDETPYGGRPPLAEQDAATRKWIARSGDLIDGPAVTATWDDALTGPAWDGRYSWIHSDLAPPNLLVADGVSALSLTSAPPVWVTPPLTSIPPGAFSVKPDGRSSAIWLALTTTAGAAVAESRSALLSVSCRTTSSATQRSAHWVSECFAKSWLTSTTLMATADSRG